MNSPTVLKARSLVTIVVLGAFLALVCWAWPRIGSNTDNSETTLVGLVESPTSANEESGETSIEVPPAPDNFTRETRHGVSWVFPRGMANLVRDFQNQFPADWQALEQDLGVDVDSQMEVRFARTRQEFDRLAPPQAPPPEYAAAVAYTDLGLIIMLTQPPADWQGPSLEDIFTHELSHIALRRAVNRHPLPRWFVEGVAVQQSGEAEFKRRELLWRAEVANALIPLDDLSHHFPHDGVEVTLAYAQASDVVGYLRSMDQGRPRFAELIEELAEGDGFEAALSDAYATTPGSLEREWREALTSRVARFPLIVGFGTVWTLLSILLVIGAFRRRREYHRKLDRMAEEEAFARAEDEAWARRRTQIIDAARAAQDAGLDEVLFPRSGDEVPKVEHDGVEHTLH